MTSKKPLLGLALAGLLVLSSVAAAGVAGSIAAETTGSDLTVAVENVGNDGATVTVEQNYSPVENASVTVEPTENGSYAGAGGYATDENGTVSLPEPHENVTVEVTAAKDDATGSTTATITVAGDESDEGGEPGDGDESGDEERSFGQLVSSFVHEMMSASDDGGPLGQMVSEFATENNPGNASENRPDHAGKTDDAGRPDHAGPGESDDEDGTAENGTDENGERGPPDHAGPHDDGNETDHKDGDGVDGETTDEEEEQEEEEEEDDGSQGPPDHAGNGRGNGNGN